MLERMREFSKSWMMKGLLGLVGLSFVLYFGATPFQKRQRERQFSAVKVNGQIISTQEFFRTYNRLREDLEERQKWPLDEQQQQEIARNALDGLIDRMLQLQWTTQAGLQVTDEEVGRRIREIWNQLTQGRRPLTRQDYVSLLSYFNYRSVSAFENDIRRGLIQERLGALLAQRTKVSEPQLREAYSRLQRQVKVAAVGFVPEDFMEQIEPERGALVRYYKNNQEQFRRPERVQVDYIGIRPEQLRDEVTLVEGRLEQFFNRDRSRYLTEPKASVDYVLFAPERFEDSSVPTEEEIRQYYDAHPDRYQMPEKIKVRYIPMALQEAATVNPPAEGMLQAEYLSSQEEYERLEAGIILLPFPDEAGQAEESKVYAEVTRIRQEIEQGKDFADAAREYSQHESASQGGSLGFVDRGQLPRALNQALFSLAVGQLSQPIRGTSGYSLLKVYGKHTAPLEEVREEVARKVAESRLAKAASQLARKTLPGQTWQGLRVLTTDFFERGKYINDLIGSDFHPFGDAAFRLKDGQTSGIVYGRRHLYLLSRIETQPPQRQPLEEVRTEIIRDMQVARAPEAARLKAEEALGLIRSEGLSFEEMAARFELEIQDSGYFSQSDTLSWLGPNPYLFLWTAFNLKPDEVSDVLTLESGTYLLRGKVLQEARLPALDEVRERVEADYRRERSIVLARDRAYEYLRRIEDQKFSLRDLARSEQLEVFDSGLFSMEEPIPGLGDPDSLFHRAAFSVSEVGEVLWDIISVASAETGETEACYLIQLSDRVPSHIPPFSEVSEQVTEDVKREMAAELALEAGEAFVKELRAAYVPSASPVLDLRQFAEQRGYDSFETPFFRSPEPSLGQSGYVPGIPGAAESPQFTRTAFALQPGQCSSLIPVQEKVEPTGSSDGEPQGRLTGYYVLQLIERKEPSPSEFEVQRQSLLNGMLQVRRRQKYRGWLDGLRAQADVVRNEAFLGDYRLSGSAEDSRAESDIEQATES